MEKKNKFKEWCIKYKKPIACITVLVFFLFLLGVKLFAFPTENVGTVYRGLLSYDIVINGGDVIGGDNLYSRYGVTQDITIDGRRYLATGGFVDDTGKHRVSINTPDSRINSMSVRFTDGLIRLGDILNLVSVEVPLSLTYNGSITGTVLIPNRVESSASENYVQEYTLNLNFEYGDDYRNALYTVIKNTFTPSNEYFKLTDDTFIFFTDLRVGLNSFTQNDIIETVENGVDYTFVQDDSALEVYNAYLNGESGSITGIVYQFYSSGITFDDSSSDFVGSDGGVFFRQRYYNNVADIYNNSFVETDLITYANNNDSFISIRRISDLRNFNVYYNNSWRNNFNGEVFFSDATIDNRDLFIPAYGQWGYYYGVIDGTTRIILTTDDNEYNVTEYTQGLNKFGGYVQYNTTLWTSVAQFFESSVGGFLDIDFFGIPNFTFGNILTFIIGVALVVWIIKVFLGG